MTRLADVASGRDNNFNLIRLMAACGVLVTHSYALVGLPPLSEPLRGLVGISFGTVAVDAFFVTSGFLVTGSLLARRNLLEFLLARVLRVYPALMALVLLTAFILGPALTTSPAGELLQTPEWRAYVIDNLTLLGGVAHYLPGLFEANPFPRAVNASLWTLPYEVWLYVSLLAMGVLTGVARERARAISMLVVLVAIGAVVAHFANHFAFKHHEHTTRLCLMFYAGAALQVGRKWVPLTAGLFFAAAALVCLAAFRAETFFVAYHLLLPYLLIWLAYVPDGAVRAFNRLGDYSYGAYLYAFPVQQVLAATIPGISLIGMLAAALAISLGLAILSWHLLEKRALALKPGRQREQVN
jgi:peptidoglycan/LPS O-acetylase OafA/YrhL